MTLLTRIVRLLRRQFEAAGPSHPHGRWPIAASMTSPAKQALAALPTIRARMRWLVSNAPIAESIASTWCTNLNGDGPTLQHPDGALVDRFYECYGRLLIGGGDGTALLNVIVRGLVTDGEAFIRLLVDDSGRLRCQPIPPEQIDAPNRQLDNGGRIESGIEVSALGEVVAYHVRSEGAAESTLIPASEILHIFEPRFAAQRRGIPWLAAVATRIVELDGLEDAALTKARVTALHCGFVTDVTSGESDGFDPTTLSMEPGSLRVLPPGADVTFPPTSDQAGLGELLRHMARSCASGAGVPYELVTGDLSGVNYSSAKVGIEAFKRRCRCIRASLLVARFLAPLWTRFVTVEVLAGRLDGRRVPPTFEAPTFLWPEWAALDPYKEARADIELMNAGIRSRAEVISARGRSIEEVDAELAADSFKQPPARPALHLVNDDAASAA